MDLQNVIDSTAEFLGLDNNEQPKKTRKKRAKKTAKKVSKKKVAKTTRVARKVKGKVGRPPKKSAPAAKPRKLPKTKLLSVKFRGDSVELAFRDLRKLTTPLKYLDKRLPKLTPRELRKAEVNRNGKSVAWAAHGILVDVSDALHFEG